MSRLYLVKDGEQDFYVVADNYNQAIEKWGRRQGFFEEDTEPDSVIYIDEVIF